MRTVKITVTDADGIVLDNATLEWDDADRF